MAARDSARLEAAVETLKTGVPESESRGAKLVGVSADMSQAADVGRVVQTALENLGGVDILVNNAGSARAGAFLEMGDEAFLAAWELKLLGYIRLVRAVAPYMIQQKDGRIVNIVGGAGRTPGPNFLAGSTANAALLNFTRGVSKELGLHNVRINAISPGTTATDRAVKLAEQHAAARGISVEQAKAETVKAMPLGKMVEPDEIASMMLLLVSDRVPSITGTEIIIDGGATPGV
jgi:3-oxoacyl-[acyl-carrier protein] reductase/bacilysin biosynthesis oxidoreductase BacG